MNCQLKMMQHRKRTRKTVFNFKNMFKKTIFNESLLTFRNCSALTTFTEQEILEHLKIFVML